MVEYLFDLPAWISICWGCWAAVCLPQAACWNLWAGSRSTQTSDPPKHPKINKQNVQTYLNYTLTYTTLTFWLHPPLSPSLFLPFFPSNPPSPSPGDSSPETRGWCWRGAAGCVWGRNLWRSKSHLCLGRCWSSRRRPCYPASKQSDHQISPPWKYNKIHFLNSW